MLIWRAGVDAKCDYFNATWLAFTGRTLEAEIGDGWAEGVHPEDFERCVKYYLDHFARREPFEMEYRLRRHDGVHRWIFDRGVPSFDASGEFLGYIGSCVDVDDRRRAQDVREQRDRDQIALAREFERWVLAIVGHDIRNPLGAIEGSAQVLARRAAGDEQTMKILERISRSTSRIAKIVEDLLDLSRTRQGGGIPVNRTATDLHTLCRDVANEIDALAQGSTIAVECEGDGVGHWDPQRLMQAVSNLVGNAVKHGTPGRAIDLHVRADNGNAIVEIHNEGAIPSDVMPRLFEPFATLQLGQQHRDGLGLGLFIARAIARAHSGDLDVDSSPERGTTFRLVLPRTV